MRKLSYTHIEVDTSQKLLQTYEKHAYEHNHTSKWLEKWKVWMNELSFFLAAQIITPVGETVYQDVL